MFKNHFFCEISLPLNLPFLHAKNEALIQAILLFHFV